MTTSFLESLLCLLILFLHCNLALSSKEKDGFTLNGFKDANLTLDGHASTTPSGLLRLVNNTQNSMGHAFHPSPLRFREQPNGTVLSFSTTFVFGIIPELTVTGIGGQGLAFVISPTNDFSKASTSEYLGLFNSSSNGSSNTHFFAIELDIIYNAVFNDIDDNHVGIDINSLKSAEFHSAGYYADDTGMFKKLSLLRDRELQVWVDYDGQDMQLNVTLAKVPMAKPHKPLLSANSMNLSIVFLETMYVGFSAAVGANPTSHYILGWSFNMSGTAQALDYNLLPSLPKAKSKSHALVIGLTVASAGFLLIGVGIIVCLVRRRIMYAELLEDWEVELGPRRFSYKDLFKATKGFKDNELLGKGGFGSVYKGVLPTSKSEVAVKRVSAESNQGLREFIAEIVSLGRLRHRNIVQLLGYCRRKTELFLVYEFMPNGSLDKFLHDQTMPTLDWATRFRITKGVALGLLYLHEDWEQVVVHRDIKASNVLLDDDFNGRLGDFGLARLHDHEGDSRTTIIVGTMGYIAPEFSRTGKATTMTDVFAFGAFMLEVACGKRPFGAFMLLDWVLENWKSGSILATRDPRLGEEYVVEEMELILKLGLLCSHSVPGERPSMRQVVQYLEWDVPLPELSPTYPSFRTNSLLHSEGFDEYIVSRPTSVPTTSSAVSGGR